MQVSAQKGIAGEEENAFSQMLFKYLPYWPLFLILLVVFIAGAWVYLRYKEPSYEITASILVKDEKKGVDDQNLMEQLDLFGSKKFVENEIEVIQSRSLMRSVVKDLSLYAPVTYEGKLVARSAYLYSPVWIQARNPDSLTEVEKVYFEYDSARRGVNVLGQYSPLYTWIHNDSVGDIRFIPNPNYRVPQVKKKLYFSLLPVKQVTETILKGLAVTQATKLSSVIDMTLHDPVPKRGENILDSLITEYEKAAIYDKNVLAGNTLKFVNDRLAFVISDLNHLEQGIKDYKTKNGIVDLSAQGQFYLDNVTANDQKLSDINIQLAAIDQVEKYVESKENQPGIVPSTFGVADPVLGQLLTQLYGLEIQYVGLKRTTAENSPIMVSLRTQIEKIKPSILENVRSQRANLEAGKENVTASANQFNSVLRTIPEKERGLLSISRQQTIENGIYSFLLQKREETALAYNSAIADTRIVDSADSTVKPVSPKHLLTFLLAAFAAFGVGALLIAAREVLNQNIVFRNEIEKFTSVPVIGEIMYENGDAPFVIEEGKRTFIAEQFRQLRTSLAYIGINNRKKRILITSSISGEGKSFIATNLSYTLALTNKKVVLLELDLRKPKISKAFNISREVGLTNYFVGQKDADHIIKRTEVNENLFIIPAGPIPPNPSELILNGKLEELLQYLDTIFDYIIIDSAPVNPVTDAYILSNYCDATLYLVRHDVTPKIFIKRLDENSKIHKLKNMAIIFNGVKSRGMGAYGYGYGYGNGYGYSYGEGDGKRTRREHKHAGKKA